MSATTSINHLSITNNNNIMVLVSHLQVAGALAGGDQSHRKHSGNIQGTFREHSGNIQGTFREHSGNIQGELSGRP